jgi:hypothetical protein
MGEEKKIIEELKPNTAQLSDWQFKETIVEKMNEIIVAINAISETVIDEDDINFKEKNIGDDDESSDEENV